MKRLVIVIFVSLFAFSGLFAKDLTFTKSISMRETDKIEFVNCTRYSDIKGYATTKDKAVGFYLKQTGDKCTTSIGDWKNLNNSLSIVIFDVDFEVELQMHADGDDLYIAIVEPAKE